MSREFEKTRELDWAQRKEIDKAIASQENIQEKLEDVQSSLEQTLESLSDNKMTSQEIGEKMEEIQKLIDNINDEALNEYVEQLKAQNFDTYIGFVPAYSTLGWFDDPVLSSFIYWPDYRLAGLLFHELAHQRIFIEDDTRFNESLAVAVQQAGTELWLESSNRSAQRDEFRRWIEYQREVAGLIEQTRETLAELYQGDQDEAIKRAQKQAIFDNTRESYVALAQRLNYEGGYESWFAGELNNAKLGSVSAYHEQLPAFLAILKARNYDFSAFFDTVENISKLDKAERDACLALWSEGKLIGDDDCVTDI